MKLNGINGTGSGKLGSAVWSVRAGQQIVRQYQSEVANPNTEGQIESRTKLKLLSQFAAVAAPVIAIPSEGLKSSRNLFISKNYSLTGYGDDMAYIELPSVQLTNSVVSNPGFHVSRDASTGVSVELLSDARNALDRVVYVAFVKSETGSLRLWADTVISVAGEEGTFPGTLPFSSKSLVLYCYGLRDNTQEAKVKFDNMDAPSAESVAKVITDRKLTSADITLTETAGVQMVEGTNNASSTVTYVTVALEPNSNAQTMTGAGQYELGQSVTINATPVSGGEFYRWEIKYDGDNSFSTLASTASYTFTPTGNCVIKAIINVEP